MSGMRIWLAACVLACGVCKSFGDTNIPLVTTTGNAEVKVTPDLADLRFDIEVRNINLKAGLALQVERMTQLLATLKSAGIEERDLQTSQVLINPIYQQEDQLRMETAKIAFYSVSQTVTCTLRDLKKITTLTAKAIDAGANRVGGVTLRTSKLRQYRDQARIQAVKAAKEKALALAGELGAKVGKAYSITEGAHDSPVYGYNMAQNVAMGGPGGGGGSSTAFEAGTISIEATVTVAFVLE
ncbi:MAG: SIMPL domain-containing protein [Gemmataceae bacterium]